ncbi:MAG: S-layer homology domain-containing protein [Clostridia bacterium]|nr:S-layer homology domain-containing protein [Clostridia bacterium]
MKKIIVFLLILSLAFVSAYASEINVDRESGVIVIYGSCEPDTKVTLLMLKDGKTKEDIPLINMLTFEDYVEYIDQTVSSSGGDFSFVYGAQKKVSFQKFNVFLKKIALDSQIEELNIVYYTKESADAVAETIIEKTSGTEIYEMMTADVFALLELDTLFYENFSEEDRILVLDEVAKLTEGDSVTLKNTFWEASLLKVINNTKSADDLNALIKKAENKKIEPLVFGLSMAKDSRYASLKDYQSMFKNNLLKKTEFESVSEYHKWCNTQLALTCIKCFKSTAIESVLEEFADVLEIDISLLDKTINKELVFVTLAGKNYDTLEDFQTAYKNAVAGPSQVPIPINPPASGSTTSSGGGGGGGGSSFGGSYNTNVVIPEAEKAPEETKITFSDINKEHYAYDSVEYLASKNIISGFPDGSFRPDANVTRAEFMKMISAAFLKEHGNIEIPAFEDVSENVWYKPYMEFAVSNGIVKGLSETALGAENNIKREELFTMIYRVCNLNKIMLNAVKQITFTDVDEISDYAAEAVKSLSEAGVAGGYNGMISPKNSATRGECAKILYEIIKLQEVQK